VVGAQAAMVGVEVLVARREVLEVEDEYYQARFCWHDLEVGMAYYLKGKWFLRAFWAHSNHTVVAHLHLY